MALSLLGFIKRKRLKDVITFFEEQRKTQVKGT
jgi:hypothetical protein